MLVFGKIWKVPDSESGEQSHQSSQAAGDGNSTEVLKGWAALRALHVSWRWADFGRAKKDDHSKSPMGRTND